MKPKKLPVDELLRLACIYAETDQEEHARCIAHTDDEEDKAKTEAFLKQLRAYRLKRWGKTKLEAAMEKMKPVSIEEAMRRGLEAQP